MNVALSSQIARANGEIGDWAMELPDDKLRSMCRTIRRIRWHERTMADKMLTDPNSRGDNHFHAEQEAVATGVCAALRDDGPYEPIDLVYPTRRPTGHVIAKGVDLKAMCAGTAFRAVGLNHGYAAEMHLSDPSVGFIGADGMIGPVLAQGSAFAFRARGSDQVAAVFGGDGTGIGAEPRNAVIRFRTISSMASQRGG